jgi:acetate kinase
MRAVRKAAKEGNAEATLAVRIFTRSVRKAMGSFAWMMGGLDAIVFTGGIGEHDVQSRQEILCGLENWGVILNTAANAAGGDDLRQVSSPDSRVRVWVVTAQEDRTIAVHVGQMERESAGQ